MLRNEISKLRRTQIWVVIVVIPALSVLLGAFNYSQNVEVLTHGWGSYWSQLVLFYGLLLMSLGVAVLASSVWRAATMAGTSCSPASDGPGGCCWQRLPCWGCWRLRCRSCWYAWGCWLGGCCGFPAAHRS